MKLLLIFLFVTHFPCADAVHLRACGTRLQEELDVAWNTTFHAVPPPPLHLSYEQCLVECGTGVGDIDWEALSGNFGAWLLPWIALMFQIPFTAERRFHHAGFRVVLIKALLPTGPVDDVLSFLITIGSPALAVYSLQITHLNVRWITKAFSEVDHPNSKRIATVLSAFHHSPIHISHQSPLLHSLIVLPKNDDFWHNLSISVEKTRRCLVPLVINFILVILAVILTILDSTYSESPGDDAYAITATWVFLLPLIIGWLCVGCEPEPKHLRKSLDAANMNTWVATERRDQPAKGALAIEFVKAEGVGFARRDELKTGPLYNYSRAFVSPLAAEQVLELVKNAAANAEQRIPVANSTGGGVAIWVEGEGNAISDENRIGTNTEVTEYCTRVLPQRRPNSTPTTLLDFRPSETSNTPNPSNSSSVAQVNVLRSSEIFNGPDLPLPLYDPRFVTQNPSRWATGICKRVALAAVLSLGLQWGTVGAAVVMNYAAPPAGLGCRALSYLLYCVAATTSFFLFLTSSVLAHMSQPHQGHGYAHSRLRTCLKTGAIICRWLGKCVAIVSAMGILAVCIFGITGSFYNCFCSSTTFDKGRGPVLFPIINYTIEHSGSVAKVWIGGTVMAFLTALLFGLSIYLGTLSRR